MADEPQAITLETLQANWTPEHKTFFENHLKTASEGAVSTYKSQLEEEAKKRIPEKYTLKVPDGGVLDPQGHVEKIAELARSRGLSNEDAQKYLESVNGIASEVLTRKTQEFADMVKGWTTEIANDKALGGENKLKTEQSIKLVTDKFGSPELVQFLNESQLGNYPGLVRFLVSIGEAMKEDKPLNLPGSGAPKDKRKPEDIMYPSMRK